MRQLENAVFRAVVLAEGDSIGVDEFPQIAAQIAAQSRQPRDAARRLPDALPAMVDVPPLLDRRRRASRRRAACRTARSACSTRHGDVRPLEEIEAEVIRFAIAHYRGQMSEVARRLRIGRSTLYRKLEHLGLAERAGPSERKEPAEAH